MNYDVQWNYDLWSTVSLPENGESWSDPFGDSETQWQCIIRPRLRSCLPARRVLEIACGWGRWTGFLIAESQHYTGVDISEQALATNSAQQFFAIKRKRAEFHRTDGKSLGFVPDNSVDFIFSFDSLVHASMDAIGGYLTECRRILTPGGKAFIHHSNMHQYDDMRDAEGRNINSCGRSSFVDAAIINKYAAACSLNVISQEKISWRDTLLNDCFTLLGKDTNYATTQFDNLTFMSDANTAKKLYDMYAI
jgi:ubiquinone/menaquinone biosynthesis C-methylase UbiE